MASQLERRGQVVAAHGERADRGRPVGQARSGPRERLVVRVDRARELAAPREGGRRRRQRGNALVARESVERVRVASRVAERRDAALDRPRRTVVAVRALAQAREQPRAPVPFAEVLAEHVRCQPSVRRDAPGCVHEGERGLEARRDAGGVVGVVGPGGIDERVVDHGANAFRMNTRG